jgi:hypothetical protein
MFLQYFKLAAPKRRSKQMNDESKKKKYEKSQKHKFQSSWTVNDEGILKIVCL